MKRSINAILFVVLAAVVQSYAQINLTDNTLNLGENGKSAPASVADFTWLAGTWKGTGLGAFAEEIYSEPLAGAMMGTFRLVDKGKTMFYEMITLVEENGTVVYRLKHFNADLTGWEEKDKTVDFRFVKKEKGRFYFEGLTLEPVGRRKLNIYVAIKQKDGKIEEALFRYSRSR